METPNFTVGNVSGNNNVIGNGNKKPLEPVDLTKEEEEEDKASSINMVTLKRKAGKLADFIPCDVLKVNGSIEYTMEHEICNIQENILNAWCRGWEGTIVLVRFEEVLQKLRDAGYLVTVIQEVNERKYFGPGLFGCVPSVNGWLVDIQFITNIKKRKYEENNNKEEVEPENA